VDSPGARLIVAEALATPDAVAGSRVPEPLYLAFLGPLTDMASALLLEPAIAARNLVVIWIGGPPYGDTLSVGASPEFNLGNDIAAANHVLRSGVTVWQVPSSVYRLVNVGYAELTEKVAPHGALGRYLTDTVVTWNAEHHPVPTESRSLGDSPAIGLMLEPWSGVFRRQAPVVFSPDGRYVDSADPVRLLVCEGVDVRFLLEDMYAKIRAHDARPA
jgi:inosine-uridine nucleoside N-ribohydrolase